MKNYNNCDEFAAYIAREFFRKSGVNRYRLIKTDEMSDEQVVKACQLYCEENNLLHEYSVFLEQEEALQTGKQYLGKVIDVAVDRPLGSHHPKHSDIVYPVNYGYCDEVFAADGEPQDVYILGIYEPISAFRGRVIAVIRRFDDVENKWVVCPDEYVFTKEEIAEATEFQEKYFKTEILMQGDF